jgi:hypothetical protein
MMRRLALLVLLLPLGLACGGDNGGNGGITDPVDTGDFPLGTFVKTIEESDVSEEYLYLVGTSRTTFSSNGTWNFTLDGSAFANGTFAVSGNQLTWTDTGGHGSCAQLGAAFASGTYTWSFDGSALTLTAVSDSCTGRRVGNTTKPFILE